MSISLDEQFELADMQLKKSRRLEDEVNLVINKMDALHSLLDQFEKAIGKENIAKIEVKEKKKWYGGQ